MNINVSTRFNIGDIVHTVYHYEDYWCVERDEFVIQEIHVNRSLRGVCVVYVLKNELYDTRCTEQHCFASYDEAKKWCLKENDND